MDLLKLVRLRRQVPAKSAPPSHVNVLTRYGLDDLTKEGTTLCLCIYSLSWSGSLVRSSLRSDSSTDRKFDPAEVCAYLDVTWLVSLSSTGRALDANLLNNLVNVSTRVHSLSIPRGLTLTIAAPVWLVIEPEGPPMFAPLVRPLA